MPKKKKRKLNFRKVLIFFFFLCVLVCSIYYVGHVKIENIIIEGSEYYSDDYILEKTELNNYPYLLRINPFKIKSILKEEDLIKDVKVKYVDFKTIKLIISDKKVLYQRKNDGLYVLDTGEEVSSSIENIPLLVNYFPNTLNEDALKAFSKLDKEIIGKISMIEYSQTEVDDERFLLYMYDGNLVYINLLRMDLLNKYSEIINQVGTKKGVLNLDSGNYFEVKEK